MIADQVLERARAAERLSPPAALALADSEDPRPLMRVAATLSTIPVLKRARNSPPGSLRWVPAPSGSSS